MSCHSKTEIEKQLKTVYLLDGMQTKWKPEGKAFQQYTSHTNKQTHIHIEYQRKTCSYCNREWIYQFRRRKIGKHKFHIRFLVSLLSLHFCMNALECSLHLTLPIHVMFHFVISFLQFFYKNVQNFSSLFLIPKVILSWLIE